MISKISGEIGLGVLALSLCVSCTRGQPGGAEKPAVSQTPAASADDVAPGAEDRLEREESAPNGAAPEPLPPSGAAPAAEAVVGSEEAAPAPPARARATAPAAPKKSASGAAVDGFTGSSSDERLVVDPLRAFEQLEVAYADFGRQLQLAEPDCGAAAGFRDAICDLASRICRLETDAVNSTQPRRCAQGQQRCQSARRDYARTCE